MSSYNNKILIQNIKMLMQKNSINQPKLAKLLEMSQSNVSKALSETDGKRFTLDQVIGIAQHFNVSIDFLVGNIKPAKGVREIGEFIMNCIKTSDIKQSFIEVEEVVFVDDCGPVGPHGSFIETKQNVKYPVIYFPSYWSPSEYAETSEEYSDACIEASFGGNTTRFQPLNDFIRRFNEIHNLFENGALSQESYDVVVQDFLNRLDNK